MAAPSSAHILSLPAEIIDILCQQFCPRCSKRAFPRHFFVERKPKEAQDRDCLSALALTCKELRRISQPHLYHRPIGRDFFGFIDTIGKAPALGQHIKELCLSSAAIRRFVDQYDDPMELFAKCDQRYRTYLPDAAQRNPMVPIPRLRNAASYLGNFTGNGEIAIDCLLSVVISFIPNINVLDICVQTDLTFWPIPSGYLPNLRKLVINVPERFPANDLDSLTGLLGAAPQLESLDLARLDLREAMKDSEMGFCHDNVNEIILRSSAIHTSRLEAIMRGFSKLQTFRFGAPQYWDGPPYPRPRTGVSYKIEDILMLRSDTLKHVTLDFPGRNIDRDLVIQDLSGMKVLETLYIDSGILRRRWQQGREPARRIFQMLPESIKEFGLMGTVDPQPVLQIAQEAHRQAHRRVHDEVMESVNISARAFPLLRKVVIAYFGGRFQADADEWKGKFASACEARNIEFSSKVPRSSVYLTYSSTYRG
ncbi:hypothetical protein FBULB1_4858 [Fusarium bulbicola]|nr:hypothetical protein FBULB1_4858 [Fusarium bulbicola]